MLFALFAALAYAVTFVFHIKVAFLTFDAKDAVICLASMLFGPAAGALIALVVSLVEMISFSDTGFWGFLMNFVSSAAFSVIAGAFYHRYRKMWAAVTGLLLAVAGNVAVMLPMNLLVTPIYMNTTREAVLAVVPTLLLPFNLIKSLLNASLVMALYQPVATALRQAGLLAAVSGAEKGSRRRTVIVLVGAWPSFCSRCTENSRSSNNSDGKTDLWLKQ